MKPFVAVFISLLSLSCHKSDPIGPPPPSPGRRDYIWTVDTVYTPYNLFLSLTGTSPTDLWAVNTGDADKTIYHYNGTSWSTDGIMRPVVPHSVYSVSPTDVWLGGDGRLWHYDGTSWSEKYRYSVDTASYVVIEDIWGAAANNLYAVGLNLKSQTEYDGVILHYDGTRWSPVAIPKMHTGFVKIRFDRAVSGRYYLVGFTDELSQYQIYQFDGRNLTMITQGTYGNTQMGSLLDFSDRVDLVIGHDLFIYASGSLNKVAHLTDSSLFLNFGCGRSEYDILLAMRDGIAHYNGTDTEYLVRFQGQVYLVASKIFENEVFFVGWDQNNNSLIFHGKLKP